MNCSVVQKKTAPPTGSSSANRGVSFPIRFGVAALAVLLSLGAHLHVLALEVPATVPAHKLVRIKHQPKCWLLIDPLRLGNEVDYAKTETPGLSVFVAPPGRYRIRELYIETDADGNEDHKVNSAYVTIGKIAPPDDEDDDKDDPDDPDDPLPTSKFNVGPATARAFKKVLSSSELTKAATVWSSVALRLRQDQISTVQASFNEVAAGLNTLNTNDRLKPGYAVYLDRIDAAYEAGLVQDKRTYAEMFDEVAQWLKK